VTFFIIALIVICAGGAALALVRGLFAFHQDAQRLRDGDEDALRSNGLQQNRMMSQRVLFQGIAIAIVALLGTLAGSR
jgi:Hypoxia induced protein conserved region